MSNVRLILHGQGHSLKRDGGVGRYAYELFQRVQSPGIQKYLPGAQITGWEFPSVGEGAVSVETPITLRVQKELKSWAKNWIPPKLANSAKGAFSGQAFANSSSASITESNGRVILHEVTNYSSCME